MNVQEMQNIMGQGQPTQPKGGVHFTPQSMQQVMNGGKITPNQAAAGLGHTTGILGNVIGGGWEALQDVSMGALKGVESTELGIGQLGAKAFGAQGMAQSLAQSQQSPAIQPQNLGEQVGKTGEQIGEFFLPGGAEEKVAAKGASLIDKLGAIPGAVKSGLNIGKKALTTGLSMGGVTAAQSGSLEKGAEAVPFGSFAGGATEALNVFGKGLGEAMQKADFKLSPAQEAKASSKVDRAAKFMTEHKILGSDQAKYAKLTLLNNSMEEALQKSLPNTVGFSKTEIANNINASIEKLKEEDPAIYDSAKRDADKAIELLNTKGSGDMVDAQSVLNSKRSYGKAAFKQSKFAVKDPNVVSEGSFAVEQGFQKTLEDTLDKNNSPIQVPPKLQSYFGGKSQVPLSEFNKVYSNAISSKQLTGLARFKNDSGLLGRFFGLWVGETLGQAVSPGLGGKFVGATLGEMASQHIPSFARGLVERGVTAPNVPEVGAKITQGAIDSGGQNMQ